MSTGISSTQVAEMLTAKRFAVGTRAVALGALFQIQQPRSVIVLRNRQQPDGRRGEKQKHK